MVRRYQTASMGALERGCDEGPGGVVEGGGLAVGDVAGVEAPLAGGERVEGFKRVELGDGGGGEVLELADGGEGLGEGGAGQQDRKGCEFHGSQRIKVRGRLGGQRRNADTTDQNG